MAELPGALPVLSTLLAVGAVWAGGRGLKLVVRGVRHADDPVAAL